MSISCCNNSGECLIWGSRGVSTPLVSGALAHLFPHELHRGSAAADSWCTSTWVLQGITKKGLCTEYISQLGDNPVTQRFTWSEGSLAISFSLLRYSKSLYLEMFRILFSEYQFFQLLLERQLRVGLSGANGNANRLLAASS